jgi:hypothetical protein
MSGLHADHDAVGTECRGNARRGVLDCQNRSREPKSLDCGPIPGRVGLRSGDVVSRYQQGRKEKACCGDSRASDRSPSGGHDGPPLAWKAFKKFSSAWESHNVRRIGSLESLEPRKLGVDIGRELGNDFAAPTTMGDLQDMAGCDTYSGSELGPMSFHSRRGVHQNTIEIKGESGHAESAEEIVIDTQVQLRLLARAKVYHETQSAKVVATPCDCRLLCLRALVSCTGRELNVE